MHRSRRLAAATVVLAALAPASARDLRAQDLPYTLDEVERIVSSGVVPQERIGALLRQRCLAFRVDDRALQQLQRAGALAPLLQAVRASCRLLPGEPRALSIEPDSLELQVHARYTLAIRGTGPDGRPLEKLSVRWSSQDGRVASVDEEGRLIAVAPGMTRVSAQATNEVSANVRVWVRPAPPRSDVAPGTAFLVGALVPGAGQFYTVQPKKGLLIFGGVAACLTAGFAVRDGDERPLRIPGVVAAAALWTYGAFDAKKRARALEAQAEGPRIGWLGTPRPTEEGGVRWPLLSVHF
ncbi:MAG: Ig-like domain-containing protein [Gemmatimonadota bacterium]